MSTEKIVQEVKNEHYKGDFEVHSIETCEHCLKLAIQKARQDFEKMIDDSLALTEKWEDYTERDKNAMFAFAMVLKQKLKSEKRENNGT